MEQEISSPSDKKGVILDAAIELFSEHGFDATSVRMVADKAGVNVAMISYYFGSKDKMFEELIIRKTEYMRNQLTSLVENTEMNPWEKIVALIDSYSNRILHSGGGFHRVLVRELSLRQRMSTSKIIEERFEYNHVAFRSIIEEGIQKQFFHAEIDIPMLMNMLIGTITQSTMSANFVCKMMNLEIDPESNKLPEALRVRVKEHLAKVFAHYLLIDLSHYNTTK